MEMINLFKNNPNDMFLIGKNLYFYDDLNDGNKYKFSSLFRYCANIPRIINDKLFLQNDPEYLMNYILSNKNLYILLHCILTETPIVKIINGAKFASITSTRA